MKRTLFILLIFLSATCMVEAVSIGVSRADLSFSDVLRGGYSEEQFIVSTDAESLITGGIEVEGDIADWVRFEPEGAENGFNFSRFEQRQIRVIVEPPIDTANGNYDGTIRVITGEFARGGDGQFGTGTRAAFKIRTTVGITDVEQRRCVIGGISLGTTEVAQPIDMQYVVENTGNVRVRPELTISIYDQLQERVITEQTVETFADTLPTTRESFLAQLTNILPPGQYWARVESDDCSGSGFSTFDVLERGGVADNGELLRIDLESFVKVGDIVPITAVFQNTGTRTVSAKFKGSILDGKRLVKVIDTDFYDTPPGAIANIETFFNPDKQGRYEVKGRVLYNNKLTYEKIAILNVSGSGAQSIPIIPILMIAVIIFLLLLIRRR